MIENIKRLIRDVPDFPEPGILFRDITPLLKEPVHFANTIRLMADALSDYPVDGLIAIESRGFLFAAPLSIEMQTGFYLVRKPGKLPGEKTGYEYDLEYGSDMVEIHTDAIEPGKNYVIVDDLIATGGTAEATANLVRQEGGNVSCCAFLIELAPLKGRDRLGSPVVSLIEYE